jgi:hypothetical protein
MKNEFMYTLLNIDKALDDAKKSGHKSFQIEVTTSNSAMRTLSNYYYIVTDNTKEICYHIRDVMNYLFDTLGYTGHDVDISDVSEDDYHSRQITVRF